MSSEYGKRAEETEITPNILWEEIPLEERAVIVNRKLDEAIIKHYDPEFYLGYASGKRSPDENTQFWWDVKMVTKLGVLQVENKIPSFQERRLRGNEIAQQHPGKILSEMSGYVSELKSRP